MNMTVEHESAMKEVWLSICSEDDLVTGSGICALLSNKSEQEQVAIFKANDNDLYAISNFDPIGEAYVLSRGILGSLGDKVVVASPLYKQHFCLTTGQCLEDSSITIKTWPVRIENGQVQLKA